MVIHWGLPQHSAKGAASDSAVAGVLRIAAVDRPISEGREGGQDRGEDEVKGHDWLRYLDISQLTGFFFGFSFFWPIKQMGETKFIELAFIWRTELH